MVLIILQDYIVNVNNILSNCLIIYATHQAEFLFFVTRRYFNAKSQSRDVSHSRDTIGQSEGNFQGFRLRAG